MAMARSIPFVRQVKTTSRGIAVLVKGVKFGVRKPPSDTNSALFRRVLFSGWTAVRRVASGLVSIVGAGFVCAPAEL
jgi:hypothetical protein